MRFFSLDKNYVAYIVVINAVKNKHIVLLYCIILLPYLDFEDLGHMGGLSLCIFTQIVAIWRSRRWHSAHTAHLRRCWRLNSGHLTSYCFLDAVRAL